MKTQTTPTSPRVQYLRELPEELMTAGFLFFALVGEFWLAFWRTLVLGQSVEEQIENREDNL